MPIDPALAPKDDESLEDLARAWIASQHAERDSLEYRELSWAFDRLSYLTDQLPEKAWKVLKLIASMDSSAEVIDNLISWPLNDLLRNFGPKMIDLVEKEIGCLPELQPLLTSSPNLEDRRASWRCSEFYGQVRDGGIGQELAPNDNESLEDFARAWIAAQKTARNSEEYNASFWTFERMCYLIEHLPNKAWRTILVIWSLDHSTKTMGMLSAGPIEDLLAKHGEEMIALVESEARRDPSFAKVLAGVWKLEPMTDEVWQRLQAVADHRGRDGIPED